MKRVFLLFFSIVLIMLATTACANGEVTDGQLVGVWQTAGFDEFLRSDDNSEHAVEVYITYDFNLYIFLIRGDTLGGFRAFTYHYIYEIIDNGQILSPVSVPNRQHGDDWQGFHITIERSRLILDATNSYDMLISDAFTLTKVSDEVPYGWTDAQRQEIADTVQRIREDVIAHAEKFGEALGLYVDVSNHVFGGGGARSVGFTLSGDSIDNDIRITISYRGISPTPTQRERHTSIPRALGQKFVVYPYVQNDRFSLFYEPNGDCSPTEEMLEVFMSLLDDQ